MSSAYDVGKTRDASAKTEASSCNKSPTKKHVWVKYFPTSPSWWAECKHCKESIYGK